VTIPSEDEVRRQFAERFPGATHPMDYGFLPAMTRLVAAHGRIGPRLSALTAQVMFSPGVLEPCEREMIAAVAAAAQDCFYCTQSHAEFLRAEGGDPELAKAIKAHRWRDYEPLSTRDRALCEIAEKLTLQPTRVVEEDWSPLRALGFDDQACLEVAHVVCLFNYFTRLADGFGLQLDRETARAGEKDVALARVGWRAGARPTGGGVRRARR